MTELREKVNMTQELAEEIIATLEENVREYISNPEKALEALVRAGLVKPNGEPEERYKTK